jgi:hypothetical protein
MTSNEAKKKNEDYSGVANSVVPAFVELSTSTEAYLGQAVEMLRGTLKAELPLHQFLCMLVTSSSSFRAKLARSRLQAACGASSVLMEYLAIFGLPIASSAHGRKGRVH